jgi:ribose transport system permease protein
MSATEQAHVPDATAPASRGRALPARLVEFLEAYALVVLLIATVVFFSVYSKTADTFPTLGNFQAVVGNQAVVAIVALAALIPIACDEWDLSVGATAGVSSIYVASAMSAGTAVWLAVLIGIGIGLGVGVFNAVVVTRIGVNGIIATLGTATLLAGVIQAKTGGVAVVSNIPDAVVSFGSGNWLSIPRTSSITAGISNVDASRMVKSIIVTNKTQSYNYKKLKVL